MAIDWQIGSPVLAPVPEMDGWMVKVPKRTHYRRCIVESGPGRDGRLLLRVKWSREDLEGRPHRIFAHPDELRPDASVSSCGWPLSESSLGVGA